MIPNNDFDLELKDICLQKQLPFPEFSKWIKEAIDKERVLLYYIGTLPPSTAPDANISIVIISDKYWHGFDIRNFGKPGSQQTHTIGRLENAIILQEISFANSIELVMVLPDVTMAIADNLERKDKLISFTRQLANLIWK